MSLSVLSPNDLAHTAKQAFSVKRFDEAAAGFERAAEGFAAAGDALMAAEMRNNASVAYLSANQAEKALAVLGDAEEVFAQAGDTKRHGMTIGNQAEAFKELGRLDEAARDYRRSADLLEQAGDDDLRLSVLQALSALHLKHGRHFEALAVMHDGLSGLQHPSIRQRLVKQILTLPGKLPRSG